MYFAGYNRIYDDKKEVIIKEKSYKISGKEFLENILKVQGGAGFTWGKLWEKSTIQGLEFNKNIQIGEDAFFCIQACKNIKEVYIINEPLYNYKFNTKDLQINVYYL